jgi:hypothetical protein
MHDSSHYEGFFFLANSIVYWPIMKKIQNY